MAGLIFGTGLISVAGCIFGVGIILRAGLISGAGLDFVNSHWQEEQFVTDISPCVVIYTPPL